MPDKTVTVVLRALIGDYQKKMGDAARSTQQVGAAGQEVGKGLSGMSGTARRVGGDMSRYVTLPLVGIGIAATKLSSDFDATFGKMQALAGVTGDQVDELKESVKGLASETGRGPQELAEALYFASSAGYDTATAFDIVTVSAKAAAAGLGTTDQVVQAVTSVMGAYGPEVVSAAEATDVLVAAARGAKIEASELSPQLGRLLPTAKLLGVNFADVAGAMAFLSQISGDASLSGTQLDGVLRKLWVQSDQGKEALSNLGLSTEDLHKAIASDGLLGALDLLKSRGLADNSEALNMLFDDIQAAQGAALLLTDETGNLRTNLEATANAAGSTSDAYAKTEGPARDMQRAWADLQVALIDLGSTGLPIITKLADIVSKVASAFGSLPDGAQQVALGLGLVVAAAGPVLSIAARIIDAWGRVSNALSSTRAGKASQLTQTMTNSAEGVDHLYTKSSRLTKVLGAAGVAGAAVGAGFALYQYGQSLNQTTLSTEELDKVTKQSAAELERTFAMLTALAQGGGAFGGMLDDTIKRLAEMGPAGVGTLQRIRDQIAATGGDTSKYDAAIAGAVTSQENLNTATATGERILGQNTEATQAATEADEALAKAKSGLPKLVDDVAGAMDKQYQSMLNPIRLTSDYEGAIDSLVETLRGESGDVGDFEDRIADASKSVADANQSVSDATLDLADAQAKLAEVQGDPDSDAEDIRRAQRAVADAERKRVKALESVTEAQESVTEAQGDLNDAMESGAFTLDTATERGRENVDAALAAGDAIAKLIEQRFRETGSVQAAKDAGVLYVEGLKEQLRQAGYTEEEIAGLIETMGLTPEQINTTFTNNAVEQQIVVGKYLEEVSKLDTSVRTTIEALIDQGKFDTANALLDYLARAREMNISPKIAVESFGEQAAFAGISREALLAAGYSPEYLDSVGVYASGGRMGAGWNLVGERGPELVDTRTMNVYPLESSRYRAIPGMFTANPTSGGGTVTNNAGTTFEVTNNNYGPDPRSQARANADELRALSFLVAS